MIKVQRNCRENWQNRHVKQTNKQTIEWSCLTCVINLPILYRHQMTVLLEQKYTNVLCHSHQDHLPRTRHSIFDMPLHTIRVFCIDYLLM